MRALPDTRRQIVAHNNEIYYPYSTDTKFGVAKAAIGGTPTSVMEGSSDGFNKSGFAYTIYSGDIIFGTTYLDSTHSVLKVVEDT